MSRPFIPSGAAPVIGRRSHARVRLGIPAQLVLLNGQRPCRLLNLSVTGAMIGIEPAPPKGTAGFLQFADVEAFGTVVWAYSKHCGIDFDLPLAFETVTAMRHLVDTHPNRDAELASRAFKAWVDGQARII